MIRGKLKVVLVVPRHSSKISTRFGHVQVKRDLGVVPSSFILDQLKLFFKKAATGRPAVTVPSTVDCAVDGTPDGRHP